MADEIDLRERMRSLPVVYELPGMDRVEVRSDLIYKSVDGQPLYANVYAPPVSQREPDRLLPAVLFVGRQQTLYSSWGKLAAASGLMAVTFDYSPIGNYEHLREPEQDVLDLLEFVRGQGARLGLDANRLGIWACSSPPVIGWRMALRDAPAYIRCLVCYYGALNLEHLLTEADPPEVWDLLREYSLVKYLSQRPQSLPPMLVVRAGRDHPLNNQSIDAFVAEALRQNAPIEVINYPEGRHAFDVLDNTDRTRQIIRRTLAFLQTHLFSEM
ncbi:MAG TPA: alpha/beta hydrolase [Ktedonobacterales bacterium]|nr:alpha/beta hydrolase [Ktedonobacterales bacterium]